MAPTTTLAGPDAEADAATAAAHRPEVLHGPGPDPRPSADPGPDGGPTPDLAARHRDEWQARAGRQDRLLQTQRETRRWESRFREAGERLRAAEAARVALSPQPPAARPTPTPTIPTPTRADLSRPQTPVRRPPGPSVARVARVKPVPAPVPVPTPAAPPRPDRHPQRETAWMRVDPPAAVPPRPENFVPPAAAEPVRHVEPVPAAPVPVVRDFGPGTSEDDADDFVIDDELPLTDRPVLGVAWRVVAPLTPAAARPMLALDFENVGEVLRSLEAEPATAAVAPAPLPIAPLESRWVRGADRDDPGLTLDAPPPPCITPGPPPGPRDGAESVRTAGPTKHVPTGPGFETPCVRPASFDTRAGEHAALSPASGPEGEPAPAAVTRGEARPRARRAGGGPRVRKGVAFGPVGGVGPAGGHEPAPSAAMAAPVAAAPPGRSGTAGGLPTVADILAARGARAGGRMTSRVVPEGGKSGAAPGAAAPKPPRPVPTRGAEPRQWRVPLRVGWLPAAGAAAVLGAAGLAGSWAWAVDGRDAGVVAGRLLQDRPGAKPLPDGVAPAPPGWWRTTARHLALWSAYLDRTAPPDDPSAADAARELLGRAEAASPLHPTVRYALARPAVGDPRGGDAGRGDDPAGTLGQPRDVLTLAHAGRRLLAAGKRAAALGAFREAIALAARPDPARQGPPTFLDGPRDRRYALPTEDLLAAVLGDLAGAEGWSFADWSGVLPRGTAAPAVAARVLADRQSPDAEAALAAALAEGDGDGATETNDGDDHATPAAPADEAEALRLAARAVALGMGRRWGEAEGCYRRAVARTGVDANRRSWWLNLADLAQRLDREPARQQALESAKSADPGDEITRRAVALQKESARAAGPVAGGAAGPGGSRR